MEVTIGGNRLGSGNKMKVNMRTYERSTHDLSFVWRSTMAAGTLVPFWTEVALPGDTFDIDLNVDVMTHPTIGPLFGSYKIQLDIFQVPMRLYQGKLHMNMLGIGMDMSKVALPILQIVAPNIDVTEPLDNQQINPSCIFSYLGIRGAGHSAPTDPLVSRPFNAIPYLGYWDIYKNYYANKQEDMGMVIHKNPNTIARTLTDCELHLLVEPTTLIPIWPAVTDPNPCTPLNSTYMIVGGTGFTEDMTISNISLLIIEDGNNNWYTLPELFSVFNVDVTNQNIWCYEPLPDFVGRTHNIASITINNNADLDPRDTEPQMYEFPLENIDTMRQQLLMAVQEEAGYLINNVSIEPYSLPLLYDTTQTRYAQQFGQEGLALKTYQSDLFNNWISTEWIDGPDGISEITAIDTSSGSFTIDELNLSKKVYDMLNRIAISGGTYDDWLDAVYTHERQRSAENPMYLGGLMRNLIFQEVVSNSRAENQPLGTLAGKGKVGDWKKGGTVIAKIDEPSYMMGIVSITPNVDYSQGNKWDVNLKTLNDLHKPALDEIGFQDLITDQMAWWDTQLNGLTWETTFKSAGKQPAWINYMTNVDVVRGNFAEISQQMFMVLARRYHPNIDEATGLVNIKDLTTYIDPSKFNHIFADTRRDAQNFWTQIGVNITARRKMSAKIMPNL